MSHHIVTESVIQMNDNVCKNTNKNSLLLCYVLIFICMALPVAM